MGQIYSVRSDGLGQRLCSLLYAKYAEYHYGLKLQVSWPSKLGAYGSFHSVESKENIFEEGFLSEFVCNLDYEYVSTNKNFVSLENLISNKKELNGGSAYIDGRMVVDGFIRHRSTFEPQEMRRYFHDISFKNNIKEVIASADNIDVGDKPIAIHVRGGDIVYGPFSKFFKFQLKAVPIYLLVDLAKSLVSKGFTPVIFLQDTSDRIYFEKINGVVFSHDMVPDVFVRNSEAAFFDFYLMSRCLKIYSGASGFSRLAAMMSGAEITDVWELYNKEKIKKLFSEVVENREGYNHNLFVYFVTSYYLYMNSSFDDVLDKKVLVDCLDEHPGDGIVLMLLLNFALLKGELGEANSIIKKSLSNSVSSVASCPLVFSIVKNSYPKASAGYYLGKIADKDLVEYQCLLVIKSYILGGGNGKEFLGGINVSEEKAVLLKEILIKH